jgi:predicted dehydrogenase
MKSAVIGAGNWGKNLVRTLHSMGALHSIAERHSGTREGIVEQYPDVPVFDDFDAVLNSDAAAVCIATPAETHFSIAASALRAGKHVFVEKPLTLSVAEGAELVEIATEQGVTLMVGHLLLYQPAIQFIKRSIDEGLIGHVYSFHQERLNLGRARSVENVLWSLGVHDVAVLLFLAGANPQEIRFSGQCALQKHVEDDAYVHLLFPDGVQAHLHSSWLWPELRRRLTVVGSKGMLVFDEVAKTVTLHKKSIDGSLKNVDGGSEEVFAASGEPLKLEMEHFLECCANGREPMSGGASAVEVLKVLEQANREDLVPA